MKTNRPRGTAKGHSHASPPSGQARGGTSIEDTLHSVGHSYTCSHSRTVSPLLSQRLRRRVSASPQKSSQDVGEGAWPGSGARELRRCCMLPPACADESFSESRETRRNLTRRQLPGDAAAVSGPIRDFHSVKKKKLVSCVCPSCAPGGGSALYHSIGVVSALYRSPLWQVAACPYAGTTHSAALGGTYWIYSCGVSPTQATLEQYASDRRFRQHA